MTDDLPEPQSPERKWEDLEASLDGFSIPEQVALLESFIAESLGNMFLAYHLAQKIAAAERAGVLRDEEGESFITSVTERVKDLQANLVIQWSAQHSDRERLEQLHHIYYPRRRSDGSLAYSLNDHMFFERRGMSAESLLPFVQIGSRKIYWRLLGEYVASHPNEPPGWRKKLATLKKRTAGKKKTTETGTKRKAKTRSPRRKPKKGKGPSTE